MSLLTEEALDLASKIVLFSLFPFIILDTNTIIPIQFRHKQDHMFQLESVYGMRRMSSTYALEPVLLHYLDFKKSRVCCSPL
jgi:hypothetical protein